MHNISNKEKMKADIQGIIASLNISENNFLVPIYEAVVNSIQSIHEYTKLNTDHKGKIRIVIKRDKTQTDLYEGKEGIEGNYPISEITIFDNGIGFNTDNFNSFNTAHSTKKIKIGGKGLGRFTMLSVFDRVNITSIFGEKDNLYERTLSFSPNYEEEKDSECIDVSALRKDIGTKITLQDLKQQFIEQSTRFSQEIIANCILDHCFLYYINEKQPEIIIEESGFADVNLSQQFNPNNYLINQYLDQSIKKEKFNFYIIKETYNKFNFYSYTADNRMVQMNRIGTILPVLKSRIKNENIDSFIGVYVTSKYLDKRVLPNRQEIKFDLDRSDNSPNFDTISEREIEQKIIEILRKEFITVLEERESENKIKVNTYLNDYGIGYRWLESEIDEKFLQEIPDDADLKKLDDLFHELEYKKKKSFNKQKSKLLSRDYSNKKEYRDLLSEVLSTINKVNESQLAQYVSHRKVVIDLLEKYLEWQEDQKQYEEESALHNLFFTMGGTEQNISHFHHNLWLIDERLSYYKFIRSDIAQKYHDVIESESAKEPDITLYDTNYKFGNITSDGEIQTIVFVEFKRPHRNDLTFAIYQKQMIEQVEGVDKGVENQKGRYMNVSTNKTIYYYYVCDVRDFKKIESTATSYGGFRLSPYGTLFKLDGNRVEEIMTYQQIKTSAIQRNRSFFKNLGID